MNTIHKLRNGGVALIALGLSLSAQAANGTWTNTASGGLWSVPGNWSGGTVANSGTADFSTLDLGADNTVHLDSARTVTTLTFGDTDPSSAAGWILDNNGDPANVLTLATITVNALGAGKSATISAKLSGTTLLKQGAGTLTLANDTAFTGAVTVKGPLAISSGYSWFNSTFGIGDSSAPAAVYQSGGVVKAYGQMWPGNGGYGYYELSGGVLTNNSYMQLGLTVTGIPGMGLFYLNGGTQVMTGSSGLLTLGNGAGTNVYYATCGSHSSAGVVSIGHTGASNGRNTLTVAGTATMSIGGTGMVLGSSTTASTGVHSLNLIGGVLQAKSIYKGNANGGLSLVNFDGGVFQASAAGTLMGTGAGGVGAVDRAYVYGGGAIFDTQAFTVTNAQSLLLPPGSGVTNLALTSNGSGYIGAPYVSLAGGGGTGATAVALFNVASGSVTGIVITSRGYGYTSAPAATLVGGGGSGAALGTPVIGANVSGGLTKLGTGTLTLVVTNTYGGATVVNNGTLTFGGAASALNGTSGITVRGGTFIDGDIAAANNNGVTDRIKNTAGLMLGGNGGGTFAMAFPASGTHAQTFGTLTVAAGANTINTTNAVSGTLNLTFAGGSGGYVRNSAGGSLNVITASGFNPGFAATPTDSTGVSVAGSAYPILVGAYLNQTDLVAAVSGNLAPPAYQTTWASDAPDNNVDVTGNLSAGNTSVNSLRFNDATARALTLASGVTTNRSGSILVTSSNVANHVIANGTLTSGNGKDLLISVNRVSDRRAVADVGLQIASVIADNGASPITLTFSGPSVNFQGGASVYLNNAVNTYSGGTYLNGVGLFINADQSLGAVPVTEQDNIFAVSGYNGLGNNSGGSLTLNANRKIMINSGASFTFARGGWIVPGRISGGGTLYINDTGGAGSSFLTVLTGNNSGLTGNIVATGYLRADEGVGLSSNANLALGDNANGVLETLGAFTRSPGTGAGQVQIGTGIYSWYGGFSAVGGALTLNFGNDLRLMTWGSAAGIVGASVALILQDASATAELTWMNPIALGSVARNIRVNSSTRKATVSGVISGAGSLGKVGVGTLLLTETNTYTGVTTISVGTLQVGDNGNGGSFGAGAVTNNAKLVISRGNSYNVTNQIAGTGTLTLNGAGTVTLSAANTYSGLTTVTNGTLAVGCDNALTNNNALTLSSGTFDAGNFSNALGTLTLSTGTTNTIAVYGASTHLSFTNMNLAATGNLIVTGDLEPSALRFGTDQTGLTKTQLAQISTAGRRVYLDGLGYLHKIPEGTLIRVF